MNASMPLRVLVTSGGTSETIDAVRRVSNRSTGRLGSLVADAFLNAGANVTYLCGENALLPECPGAEVHRVESVANLDQALESLFSTQTFDGIIHAMAVSDYTPCLATSAEQLAAGLGEMLRQRGPNINSPGLEEDILETLLAAENEGGAKLSSNIGHLALFFTRTPKIIGKMRASQPHACLVGFKLLAGAEEGELAEVAGSLLQKNNCDFVLANDQSRIAGDAHFALLVGPGGVEARMKTKQEIASALVEAVTKTAGQRRAKKEGTES